MDTRERRILDPSELPTRPAIRLPRFSLPPALPRVPLVPGWLGGDGGSLAPGALTDPTPGAVRGKEVAYGGR